MGIRQAYKAHVAEAKNDPLTSRHNPADSGPSNRMMVKVNGEFRQQSATSDLILSIATQIAHAASFHTLYPGDILTMERRKAWRRCGHAT